MGTQVRGKKKKKFKISTTNRLLEETSFLLFDLHTISRRNAAIYLIYIPFPKGMQKGY